MASQNQTSYIDRSSLRGLPRIQTTIHRHHLRDLVSHLQHFPDLAGNDDLGVSQAPVFLAPLLDFDTNKWLLFFTAEYFFGPELLRPVLLWLILSETIPELRKRISRVGLFWIPYAILDILFLAWRSSNLTPRAKILIFERLSADPSGTLLDLGRTILQDLIEVTVLAWKSTLNFAGITAYEPNTILKYILISLGAAIFTVLFLAFLHENREPENVSDPKGHKTWTIQAISISVFALIVAGIPFWTTFLPVTLSFPRDRFTLPFMLGSSILVVGLIEALPRLFRYQNIVLVGVAVGLAAGMHFQTSLSYHWDWLQQKRLFWQLTWRAPAIQPGTLILATDVLFPYNSDLSLSSPLNWIYAPDSISTTAPYYYYNVESHITRHLAPFREGLPIHVGWRLTKFQGNLSQAFLTIFREQSCLKIVDPTTDRGLPEKPRFFREALPFSKS